MITLRVELDTGDRGTLTFTADLPDELIEPEWRAVARILETTREQFKELCGLVPVVG